MMRRVGTSESSPTLPPQYRASSSGRRIGARWIARMSARAYGSKVSLRL